MKYKALLATLTAIIFFGHSKASAIDSSAYYFLSNNFTGEHMVLQADDKDKKSSGVMLAKRDSSLKSINQLWQLKDLGNGYYRLITKWRGKDYSLDILNDGKNNNRPQMARSGNFSGQMWQVNKAKDGTYRLSTMWRGPKLNLDVINEGSKSRKVILAKAGNFSGQQWRLTKVNPKSSSSSGKKK